MGRSGLMFWRLQDGGLPVLGATPKWTGYMNTAVVGCWVDMVQGQRLANKGGLEVHNCRAYKESNRRRLGLRSGIDLC